MFVAFGSLIYIKGSFSLLTPVSNLHWAIIYLTLLKPLPLLEKYFLFSILNCFLMFLLYIHGPVKFCFKQCQRKGLTMGKRNQQNQWFRPLRLELMKRQAWERQDFTSVPSSAHVWVIQEKVGCNALVLPTEPNKCARLNLSLWQAQGMLSPGLC